MDLEVGGNWYVGATKASNGAAEVQASIMASLWVLQSEFRAVTLCFDAQYAENIASALANPKTNLCLANLASALRRTVHAVCSCVYSQHVKSHSGLPWNERADGFAIRRLGERWFCHRTLS